MGRFVVKQSKANKGMIKVIIGIGCDLVEVARIKKAIEKSEDNKINLYKNIPLSSFSKVF